MKRVLCALAAVAFSTGCAGCATNDPGTGTGTLWVDARAQSDGSSNGTIFLVYIRENTSSGNCVTDATVTFTGDKGTVHTASWIGLGCFGVYTKSGFTWESGWHLRIERGVDNLQAYVAGPGQTIITEPLASSTFTRSANLPVAWHDEIGRHVTSAEVDFRRAPITTQMDDTGFYAADYNQMVNATDERVTVKRWTEVPLRGGAAGSTLRATTQDEVQFIVQ